MRTELLLVFGEGIARDFVRRDCKGFHEKGLQGSALKVYEYTAIVFYHFYKGKQLS